MKTIDGNRRTRVAYLDLMRSIAIICVALNHAVNRAYKLFQFQAEVYPKLSALSFLTVGVSSVVSRFGVPFFLMITGALILKKDFSTKEKISGFYRKNLLPILITTEIWLLLAFWHLEFPTLAEQGISALPVLLGSCLRTLFMINPVEMESMWYMPMILCTYCVLPIVAMVKDRLPKSTIILTLGIVFLSAFLLPAVNNLLPLFKINYTISWDIDFRRIMPCYLLYAILGYAIHEGVFSRIRTWVTAAVFFVPFMICVGLQLYGYADPDVNYVFAKAYGSGLLIVMTGALFELGRRAEGKLGRVRRILARFSKIAFGIYFVHIFIIEEIRKNVPMDSMGNARQLILYTVVSVVGAAIIVDVLSHIPFCRKYFFMIKD